MKAGVLVMAAFAVGALLGGVVAPETAVGRATTNTTLLSDADLCDMWVTHNVRRLIDVWGQRFGVTVICSDGADGAEPGIVVVVVTANGSAFVGHEQRLAAEQRIRGTVEAALEGAAWRDRFGDHLEVTVPF